MKIYLLLISVLVFQSINNLNAQTFYNHYPSNLDLETYDKTDVIEINNELYKVETETNNTLSFHQNIRIIKTDINGNIIWAKQYDAGTGISLKSGEVVKSFDNNLLLNIGISGDNSFPYYSVVIKVDTNGNLIWQKKLGNLEWKSNDVIFQIPNSKSIIVGASLFETGLGNVVRICKLDESGDILKTIKINTPAYSLVESCAIFENELSFVIGNHFIITDTLLNIISQKTYNTESNLKHNVTSNGDYIFVSNVSFGGLGNGIIRVFRTNSTGTLLWSKNLIAWKDFIIHTNLTRFDFTLSSQVFEDFDGKIVVNVYGEELNPNNSIIQFDSLGNYINSNLIAGNKVWLCSDSEYLFAENHNSDYFGKANLNLISSCYPLLDVSITNGTDSLSNIIPSFISSSEVNTSTDFIINQNNTTLTPIQYCNTSSNNKVSNLNKKFEIYPNPVQNILYLDFDQNSEFYNDTIIVYNSMGVIIKEFKIMDKTIDISSLSSGLYYLKLKSNNETYKLIKL